MGACSHLAHGVRPDAVLIGSGRRQIEKLEAVELQEHVELGCSTWIGPRHRDMKCIPGGTPPQLESMSFVCLHSRRRVKLFKKLVGLSRISAADAADRQGGQLRGDEGGAFVTLAASNDPACSPWHWGCP